MPGEGSVYPLTVKRPGKEPLTRWVAALTVGQRGATKKHVRYLRQSEVRRLSAKRTPDQAERACRRAAEKLLATLIDDVRAGRTGRPPSVAPTTLGDFLHGWHEVYVHGVGTKQRENTAALIRDHIEPGLGDAALGDLRGADIERLLGGLRGRLGSQSVRHVYNLLAVALDSAVRDELIARNPVRLVKPPAVVKQPRQPWSTDEAIRFFEAAREDRYYAAYVLAVVPGLRQGEILGLAWSDVDLEGLSIRVDVQLQRRDGMYVRVATKTKRESSRSIDEDVAAVLAAHKARQDAERPVIPLDGLVFVTEQGRPVNGSWLTHHFERLSRKAGLRVIPFHALRNVAGSEMAGAGVSPRVAQDQLGHANISTTLGIYTHTTTEQGRDAAHRVARKLRVAG